MKHEKGHVRVCTTSVFHATRGKNVYERNKAQKRDMKTVATANANYCGENTE
jgi:hypothetical protein